MAKRNATFNDLIKICDELGWDRTINAMESIVRANENAQAYLFGGDYYQRKQASKLGLRIIEQNITIARLKAYRREKDLVVNQQAA